MSNSGLVSYTRLSPNKTSPRNHVIDTITIHCYVGQVTVQRGCETFASASRKASCNYVVAKDGRIGLVVDEGDRSWCSSNSANDHRAITIEVASDTTHPYAVTDAALNALVELCADICKRNNIEALKWSFDKTDRVNHLNGCNMTVHRDFAAKACPGEYLYNRHGWIADEVNKRLSGCIQSSSTSATTVSNTCPFTIKVANVKKGDVLNIRKQPSSSAEISGKLAYNDPNVYTIVEEQGTWGRLKSGIGWINLKYTVRV